MSTETATDRHQNGIMSSVRSEGSGQSMAAMRGALKVGVIGAGAVGCACLLSTIMRGFARETVLVNRNRKRAKGVVSDMQYGTALSQTTDIYDGEYADLAGAALVMITAGVNEKTGGATDRNDPAGRLKLLEMNVAVYEEILPELFKAAPDTVVLVVTDPPDPLADLVRRHGFSRVLSTGTYLDSLRFRFHLARHLNLDPRSVEAQVLGEHGTSEVLLWSSARVAGVPALDALQRIDGNDTNLQQNIEREVRYANIAIIEGNLASQYGIGMVSARVAEIVLRDERAVIPIGSYNPRYGVTLSMPSVLGRDGVAEILDPLMSEDERQALERSAATLRNANSRLMRGPRKEQTT
jgi:L-lactate dehydrogenase